MATLMAPVRAEHRELQPYIEQLRVAADELGALNGTAIRARSMRRSSSSRCT